MPPPREPTHQTVYVGIDPGVSGGIAVLHGSRIQLLPFATTSPHEWCRFLEDTALAPASSQDKLVWPIFATIERVGAMPGQGVTSMFTFGKAAGKIEGIIIALSIPYEDVTPQGWQSSLGVVRKKGWTDSQWKNWLVMKARQLFPKAEGISKATADALLIAEYARRKAERKR